MNTTIDSIPKLSGTKFSGEFRALQPKYCKDQFNRPYVGLTIADATGSLPAYCWKTESRDIPHLSHLTYVRVEGRIRWFDDRWIVDISDVDVLLTPFESPANAVQALPLPLCPEPEVLVQLVEFTNNLQIAPLETFIQSVFADDKIAIPFLQAPASLDHHHHQQGGLLVHSMECVKLVQSYPLLPGEELEIGAIAALLHDVGKVATHSPRDGFTATGHLIDHNTLTNELLAIPLCRLQEECPDLADALRYIWAWKPGYKGDRHPPHCGDRGRSGRRSPQYGH